MRVALRRAAATASALGEPRIEKRSRTLTSSLSDLRQLEIDRHLLSRVRILGLLTEEAASSLEARWDSLHADGLRRAARVARGRRMRRLMSRLSRKAKRQKGDVAIRLELARGRAERRLAPPATEASDRQLHRYRIALKKARYLAEDLSACGIRGLEGAIAREKELQDSLGRWNDVRLFRERLVQARSDAESRGSVTLALELDRLIGTLSGTVSAARSEALAAAGRLPNVLPFLERSA